MRAHVRKFVQRLASEESGQGMTEYALIQGLLVIGLFVALGSIGSELDVLFSNSVEALRNVADGVIN